MNCPERSVVALVAALVLSPMCFGQQAGREGQPSTRPARGMRGGQGGPRIVSPEVSADRHVTFRFMAADAQGVRVEAGDIPGIGRGEMQKKENGVWELTVGPLKPGAYRYHFLLSQVPVVDPRSPAVSLSNNIAWSVVVVPGSDFMDVTDVRHGAVAAVFYPSKSLGKTRRMHVYTPPGYESGQEKYPVFYLLHGAGDSDDSWTSVGRANFILDNLIAQKKARPMIVVMPAGHTSEMGFGGRRGGPNARDEFAEDFVNDIMPYVESHYRVLTDRPNRAIAGLSMGGGQTLGIAFAHLDEFAYVGVFSSGIFGGARDNWEDSRKKMLDDPALKSGLKLLWFSTGSDDRVISSTRTTVDFLKQHQFNPVFVESSGGHTWLNWRDYLDQFAPQLFRD
jgi:enterochelin esterase family protein